MRQEKRQLQNKTGKNKTRNYDKVIGCFLTSVHESIGHISLIYVCHSCSKWLCRKKQEK